MKKIFALALLPLLYACNTGDISSNTPAELEAATAQPLDTASYEILATKHTGAVENYHVLIKSPDPDSTYLSKFVYQFRKEQCYKCNINLYDDRSIEPLIEKFPLEGQEYILMADHLLASSSFDVEDIWIYPYKDIKYKEIKAQVAQ